MIQVRSRGQTRTDRAGDPLDGLVNMFDLGVVLAVAFLIAALQAHNLTNLLTKGSVGRNGHTLVVKPNQQVVTLKHSSQRVTVKSTVPIGSVYQLPDGKLVYVRQK
jgi:hypothetical protein